MKLKYILTSIIFSLILTVGCTTKEFLDHSEIKVSESIVGIAYAGGSSDITLATTADWVIKAEEGDIPEWLTISKLSGSANPAGESIKFSADETTSNREVTLNIVAADKVQYLIIKQTSTNVEVVITPASEIAANGVNGKIYYVEGVITSITNTLYGNVYLNDGTGEVYIYGMLDKNGQEKNFLSWGLAVGDKVLVSGPYSASYKNLVAVTVHNIEKSLLAVDPTEVEFESKEAGEVTVNVTCKGEGVDVDIDEDWLKVKTIVAKDDVYTITFSAGANETVQPREANVTFSITGDDSVAPVSVTVSQAGNEPAISTIKDAIAQQGEFVTIEGVVVAAGAQSYIVSDGTAAINVYEGEHTARMGDKIKVVGEMGAYNFFAQMRTPAVEEKDGYVTSDKYPHLETVVMDGAACDAFAAQYPSSADGRYEPTVDIKRVTITGELSYGSYVNVYIDGASTAQGSVYSLTDAQKEMLEPLDGKKITLTGYLMQISSGKYMNIVMNSVEEVK